MPVQHLHGEYSVKTLYLNHQTIPGIDGDTFNVDYGGFLGGEMDQRIFVLSAAAPLEK